jgi:hypothetical protein
LDNFPAALIAFSVQASAIDFNKASEKQAYCQAYATQAVADVYDARKSEPHQCSHECRGVTKTAAVHQMGTVGSQQEVATEFPQLLSTTRVPPPRWLRRAHRR